MAHDLFPFSPSSRCLRRVEHKTRNNRKGYPETDVVMAGLRSGCAFLVALTGVSAFVPQGLKTAVPQSAGPGFRHQEHSSGLSSRPMRMSLDDVSESRQGFLKDSTAGLVAGAIAVGASTGASPPAEAATVSAWEQIQLPVASVLYDIAFDPEHPDHGLVVGAQGTFLEVSAHWIRPTLHQLQNRRPDYDLISGCLLASDSFFM